MDSLMVLDNLAIKLNIEKKFSPHDLVHYNYLNEVLTCITKIVFKSNISDIPFNKGFFEFQFSLKNPNDRFPMHVTWEVFKKFIDDHNKLVELCRKYNESKSNHKTHDFRNEIKLECIKISTHKQSIHIIEEIDTSEEREIRFLNSEGEIVVLIIPQKNVLNFFKHKSLTESKTIEVPIINTNVKVKEMYLDCGPEHKISANIPHHRATEIFVIHDNLFAEVVISNNSKVGILGKIYTKK